MVVIRVASRCARNAARRVRAHPRLGPVWARPIAAVLGSLLRERAYRTRDRHAVRDRRPELTSAGPARARRTASCRGTASRPGPRLRPGKALGRWTEDS